MYPAPVRSGLGAIRGLTFLSCVARGRLRIFANPNLGVVDVRQHLGWIAHVEYRPQSLHYGAAQMFGRIGSDHQPKPAAVGSVFRPVALSSQYRVCSTVHPGTA
jgi:hypothetical protein